MERREPVACPDGWARVRGYDNVSGVTDEDVLDIGAGGRRTRLRGTVETYQWPRAQKQQTPPRRFIPKGQRHGARDERFLRGWQREH